ncbi:hypothetical protein ACTFIY_001089 [Dictyostelium cf. discoideum]
MTENSDNTNSGDVAVIGIGLRFPSGNLKESISKPNQLFNELLNGLDGIVSTSERWSDNYYLNGEIVSKFAGLLPLDEWKQFDPIFFAINPSKDNVSSIDPQQRLLLKCIIGYCFDFRGENITIDTACSSSANAINCGYNSIKSNKSNVSIVGVNFILDPHISKSFTQLGLLSPTGKCHAFSSDADGYVRSEGVGIVVLKKLKDVIKDSNNIYCVIKGSSSNIDGDFDKLNFYSPSKSSQYENIKLAIKSTNGQINESDIDYCETHGTGTPTGDPIELEGISRVFSNTKIPTTTTNNNKRVLVGSIKSNIGHTEACSGVALLIKCCLMFKNKLFLQNINFKEPNPLINFKEWGLKVVTEPIKQTVMLINNFGITGSNVCIILSEFCGYQLSKSNDYHKIDNKVNEKKKYLIPLSSNSSISLNNYKLSIIKHSNSIYPLPISFKEFVYNQIKFKSTSLIQKSVIIASSQYNKMALSLYDNEPIFRESVNRFDKELFKYYGYSVLDKLRSIDDKDLISIHQPILAQPANIMIQVSLYELYKHWGVSADIIIGHSLGEISSAYCSGMIDFQTLCYLTYHRSVAQNRTTGTGRMLSVNISSDEFINKYQSTTKYESLEITCYNSPTSIVIAGNEDLLNEITNEFKSNDIFCSMLGSLSLFHTSSQLMIKDEVYSLNISSKQPSIAVFSTVTTNLFNHQSSPFNADYVFNNIIQPVLSPHPTLQYYLNQMKSTQSSYFNNGKNITIYSPLNKKKNDYNEFLKTISLLYVNNNFNINFKSQLINNSNNYTNQFNNLPLYQWDNKEYFKINLSLEKIKSEGPSIHSLGNNTDSPYLSYQTFIDIKKSPFQWLKGHQVSDKFYYPGMGYVHNLLSIYPNQDITISSLEFKSPFVLTEGNNQCLQTTITPLSKNEFNIKSHYKDQKTNQWILSSLGNFSLTKHNSIINNKLINIQSLKDKCNFTSIPKQDLYEAIRIKTNLTYKGLFQGVKQCYIGNSYSLAIVSLNEIYNQKEYNHLINNSNMNSFFNAAILDSCLHGSLVTVTQPVVLDRIEGFKFYSSNIPSCPSINFESLTTLEYNQFKQLYYKSSLANENLFKFIFENLKKYSNVLNHDNENNNSNIKSKNEELYIRTTKIMAKQLFPLKDDDSITDTPQSLFESGYLDDFYKNSRVVQPLNNLLSEIIVETLKPILNEPIVFRILEAGGGTGSLSLLILEKICKLLNDNSTTSIINIEFTWSDISASFFAEIKEKFSSFTNHSNLNIIYRVLDLEKPLLDQDLKSSYYDFVVMSNVMHVVKKLKPTLNEIHNILTPNGQLLFVEPPYKSFYYDCIFGCFSQWWPSFDSDIELRPDRCCMKQEKWVNLLNQCNYRDTIMSGNDNLLFLIQTRKPTINEIISEQSISLDQLNSFNNIILFSNNKNKNKNRNSCGSSIQNLITSLNQELKHKIININNFNEFQSWITNNQNKDNCNKTLIIFLKSIESTMDTSNFKEITFEYIQINQLILKLEFSNNFKHLLLSLNSSTDNYLSSSIIGAARYFVEFPQLDLLNLNYDNISIENNQQLSLINYLINPNNNIEKEFTVNNNKVYYERYLNSNLEYQLYSKKDIINSNEVEIEVKATGINYKDYLMYIGMIGSDLDIKYGKEYEIENGIGIDNPNIGNDFSGIITRLGSDVKKFKVGDQVCGVGSKTSSSHVIVDFTSIYYKPLSHNHSVSASIPSIYITSLHSIYSIGNLKSNESILIHSAAGGIGISSLDLLKCKQHKGYIFLTVGSKDKEKYLINKYGSLITAIYSSRNKDYVYEIKNKLMELGEVEQHQQGVDLILNTLSSEFMDSNFQCLNMSGRIVDLSITHLTPNDYMTNNHYKFNMGYNNVEVVDFPSKLIKSYLKKIIKMINSNKLELGIPIIEYSNNQFKDAIEYINQRKHIGKIIVNHSQDEFNRVYNNYQNNNNQIIMKHSYDISKLNIGKNILLTGQTAGIGHSNDFVSNFLKASKEIGYCPNIHKPMFTTQVTTIAKTTIDLIFNENSWNQNKSKPISIYSLNGNPMEMKSFYELLKNNFNCKEIDYQEWIELVSKSNEKSSKRYSTFHIHDNQNLLVSNFKINSLFKMSNSTKELLISIGSYNHQDWEINESMILNDINNNN